MVMWTIPEIFGGMTSMCLRRSRNFLELAGINAPILCFDTKANHDTLCASLVERGHLTPDMKILNVFDYYRSKDMDETKDDVQSPALESLREYYSVRASLSTESVYDSFGDLYARITKNSKNVIVYRECFRRDGTVFFADASSLGEGNKVLKRKIWLLDPDGKVSLFFNNASAFYRNWLLELADGERTTFIFDDKVAATNLRHLEAPNIVKITPVHSNHIKSAGDPVRGELDPNRRLILTESKRWDAIVFLTEVQLEDYADRFGATSNLFVCPNPSRELPRPEVTRRRIQNRGVMLGKLVSNKNMLAAIDIINLAKEKIPDIKLDIFGEGPLKEALQQRIDSLNLTPNVELHGYRSGAATEYETASFSLLTSRYEGFPLTLIESMAYGCPPISFDFRYGPASLIRNEQTGFLVPNGDVKMAASRVVEICAEPDRVNRMGMQAWLESRKYSDSEVVNRWGEIVDQCWNLKRDRLPLVGLQAVASKISKSKKSTRIFVDVLWNNLDGTEQIHEVLVPRLQVLNRTSGPSVEVPIRGLRRTPQRVSFVADISDEHLATAASKDNASPIDDLIVIAVANNVAARLPLNSPKAQKGSWTPVVNETGQTAFFSGQID